MSLFDSLPAHATSQSTQAAMPLPFPVSLASKYQPRSIDGFIGLEKPKKILGKFASAPYSSAWLFCGASGTGKSTMALALCDAIAGELIHIPSSHCTVAELEESLRMTQYYPMAGKKFWFVLVDEADKMSKQAALALLSKLDATNAIENCVFCFTCNTTEGLEDRFLSRTRQVSFSAFGNAESAAQFLANVWDIETSANPDRPNFLRLVRNAGSNIRESLMSLETEILAV